VTEQCKRVLEHLGEPISPELSAHVHGCDVCKEAVEGYELLGRGPSQQRFAPGAPTLQAEVAAELARHRKARSWRYSAMAVIGLNLLVALAGAIALAHGRYSEVNTEPKSIVLSALLAGLLAFGPYFALAPGKRGARWVLLLICSAIAIALVVLRSSFELSDDFVRGGIGCLMTEVIGSVLPLAVGIWVLTSAAFQPLRAALVALSGAAAGLFVLQTHCENGLPAHLLAFHLFPWLLVTGIAVWARARLQSRTLVP
jgi:hypothetical protein